MCSRMNNYYLEYYGKPIVSNGQRRLRLVSLVVRFRLFACDTLWLSFCARQSFKNKFTILTQISRIFDLQM